MNTGHSVSASGGRLGCGTILVVDDRNCIVDVVLNNLDFFRGESCGKCTPCREGGQQLYNLVRRIAEGKGSVKDLDKIDEEIRTQFNVVYLKSVDEAFRRLMPAQRGAGGGA